MSVPSPYSSEMAVREAMPPPNRIGRFTLIGELGRGGGSVVYAAHDEADGGRVAIKVYDKSAYYPDYISPDVLRALCWTTRFRHGSIVGGVEVLQSEVHVYHVMEYLAGGDVGALVETRGALPPRNAREAFRALLICIRQCHDNGCVHGALHLGKLLLDAHGLVKVNDVGAAPLKEGLIDPRWMSDVRRADYIAPELWRENGGRGYSASADMWAAGVTLYCMVTGSLPFAGDTVEERRERVLAGIIKYPAYVQHGPRAIISRLLKVSPEERPSAAEVLQWDWMCSAPVGSVGLERMSTARESLPFSSSVYSEAFVEHTLPPSKRTVSLVSVGNTEVDCISEASFVTPHQESPYTEEHDSLQEQRAMPPLDRERDTRRETDVGSGPRNGRSLVSLDGRPPSDVSEMDRNARSSQYSMVTGSASLDSSTRPTPAMNRRSSEELNYKYSFYKRMFGKSAPINMVHVAAPLVAVRAHSGTSKYCAVSRSGKVAVTAGDDGIVKVWNPATGTSSIYAQHEDAVRQVALSLDGATAVSASLDGTVRVWDVQSLTTLYTLRQRGFPWAQGVSLSADSNYFVATFMVREGELGIVVRCNWRRKVYTEVAKYRRRVMECHTNYNASRVALLLGGGVVHVLDIEHRDARGKCKTLGYFEYMRNDFTAAFDLYGADLLIASQSLVLHSLGCDGAPPRQDHATAYKQAKYTRCSMTPDCARIVSAEKDGVKVRCSHTGDEILRLLSKYRVTCCAISADGVTVVGCNEKNDFLSWNIDTLGKLRLPALLRNLLNATDSSTEYASTDRGSLR